MTGDGVHPTAPPFRPRSRLTGGVAVVTGGTRGIGAGIARALAAGGSSVAALARGSSTADDVGSATRIYRCDVCDERSVQHAIAKVAEDFGRIDVLVTSAGIAMASDATVAETTPREFESMLRTNVLGTYLAVRAALPHLRLTRGQIVTVLSLGAHRVRPGSVAYAATKHAARALTEGLALEESPRVRISSVSPGPVDTSIWDRKRTPPDAATRSRMLTADDIADAVVWLLERPENVHVPDVRVTPADDPFGSLADLAPLEAP